MWIPKSHVHTKFILYKLMGHVGPVVMPLTADRKCPGSNPTLA